MFLLALIICPDCGKEISDQSKMCIHCGCLINNQISNKKKIIIPIIAVILIVVLVVLGFVLFNRFINKDSQEQITIQEQVTTENNTQSITNNHSNVDEDITDIVETTAYLTNHTHTFSNATCVNPKRCSTCGVTEGSALGHKDDGTGYCVNCSTQLYVVEVKEEIITSSTSLAIQEPTTITIDISYPDNKYPNGVTLNVDYDSNIVEIEWGEWDGLSIPIEIIPIQNGTTTLKFYFAENHSVYRNVNVTVKDNNTDDEPYENYGDDVYYQLAQDAYKYEQKKQLYPHSIDIIMAEAGTLNGEKAVFFSFMALDAYGDNDWYNKVYTSSGGRVHAYESYTVDFVELYDLDVNSIIVN